MYICTLETMVTGFRSRTAVRPIPFLLHELQRQHRTRSRLTAELHTQLGKLVHVGISELLTILRATRNSAPTTGRDVPEL